ncbi:MFS transporter [Natronocalculus amylovorans]|uniref:MFS transporter n=1 Tax=Natronocalculus amylovorans TaxID=2917812 RepID=A0AAE3FXS0_9EURY|nr:MFS transporter [Natronocalculus amylovorans]MCL9817269.1 MFS transporter [Natronocalculus amylovorans]NUE02703.1 MFS transporter [Halorubraceae archaeon YAN]
MSKTAQSDTGIGSKAVILAVVGSTFFVGFGGGVIFPILPNLGVVLGITPFMVGIILSANRFTRLFMNAPAGMFADRFGTRKPFIIGLFIQGFATLGYVIALNSTLPEAWFLAARLLWGIGSAFVFATAYTIVADITPSESRGLGMGVVRGGITLGFPTGVVLGGIVSEWYGISEAFILAAVFALLAGVVAFATVPETHVEEENSTVKPWDVDTSIPAVTVGLVNFGLYFAYIGALFASLVIFLDAYDIGVFGFGAQGSSGIFMAVTVLSASAFMIIGGKMSDMLSSRVPPLMGFIGVSFIGFILLTLSTEIYVLTIACILIGAGQGGTSGPLIALLADLTPSDRMGRAMGTNNVFGDIGGGLGPVVTLPLIDWVGFAPIYAACAVIPLLAGAVLLVGIRRETGSALPKTDLVSAD